MVTNRRTRPTPLDFACALARMPNTRTSSLLEPQLRLSASIPPSVAAPKIPDSDPEPSGSPDLSALLQPLIPLAPPSYVPAHFPQFPPHHAWKATPVHPGREKDAREMRERATEEGVLAEQALRRLAAAAKSGVRQGIKGESDLNGAEERVPDAKRRRLKHSIGFTAERSDAVFAQLLAEVGQSKTERSSNNAARKDAAALHHDSNTEMGMTEGVVVKWEVGGLRQGRGYQ